VNGRAPAHHKCGQVDTQPVAVAAENGLAENRDTGNGAGADGATQGARSGSTTAPPYQSVSALAGLPLREVERLHIAATLDGCGWNQTRAASTLGIDRKTLRTKIRDYGLTGGENPNAAGA